MLSEPKVTSVNEEERLNALSKYNILDTIPEQDYDEIANLAAYITKTPVSHISFLAEDRNWFKAKVGVDITETPREASFCQHAIPTTELFFEIPNTLEDERFIENPFVANDPKVRYYASVLLRSSDGFNIGTLCVLDLKPRVLDDNQRNALLSLGNMVTRLLEDRKMNAELKFQSSNLKISNQHLEQFASVVSHDLRSPLTAIKLAASMMKSSEKINEDDMLKEMVDITMRKCEEQARMIENILAFSRTNLVCLDDVEPIILKTVISKVLEELDSIIPVNVTVNNEELELVTDVISLHRIFLNLFSNSVKHNDKDEVEISVNCDIQDGEYHFEVSDNGPGISEGVASMLFEMNFVKRSGSNSTEKNTGIGLYSISSIIERLGGSIKLNTNYKSGASFTFHIDDLSSLKVS